MEEMAQDWGERTTGKQTSHESFMDETNLERLGVHVWTGNGPTLAFLLLAREVK